MEFAVPVVVQQVAFREMSTLEKISYSLQSGKQLTESIIPQAKEIEIFLERDISIKTDIADFSKIKIQLDTSGYNRPISMPISVQIQNSQYERPISLNHPEFSVRDWLQYLKDVLRCVSFKLQFRGESKDFNKESILETFRGFDISDLEIYDCSGERTRWYLENFQPTRHIRVGGSSGNPLPDVLRRELHSLHLLSFNLTLPNILLLNSQNMIIEAWMTGSDYNQLLKKWMRGWNSGLKSLMMNTKKDQVGDGQIVMNGIPNRLLPNDYDLSQHELDDFTWKHADSINGVYEINGDGGKKAVISLGTYSGLFIFKMVVL